MDKEEFVGIPNCSVDCTDFVIFDYIALLVVDYTAVLVEYIVVWVDTVAVSIVAA